MSHTWYVRIPKGPGNPGAQEFVGLLTQLEHANPALQVITTERTGSTVLSFDALGLSVEVRNQIESAIADAGLHRFNFDPITPEERLAGEPLIDTPAE